MPRTVFLAALSLAAVASPAAAHDSWGKPDVGFAEYRIDADQCSNAAFDAKLWMGPIDHVMRATMKLQTDIYMLAFSRQIMTHGVSVTIADQLQNAVDRCLIDRGYTKFRLTDAQERRLSHFRPGTVERAHFLHSLAADPAVMAAQAIPTVRPHEAPADEGKPTRKEPPHVIDLGPRPV
ncbi:MAG TPA: hypothetical protein VFW19_14445 [Allosphingosinicella sp.]|nr:hypothetical protein [Allosphingosinicella sp.]